MLLYNGKCDPVIFLTNTLLLGSPQISKRAVEEDEVHSTGPEAEKEMERILQQKQTSLMKAIPDLEVSKQVDSAPSQTPSILPDEVDSPLPGMSVQCPLMNVHINNSFRL